MPYICSYEFCRTKIVATGQAVACTRCRKPKAMHPDCFAEHNRERHGGKATSKAW